MICKTLKIFILLLYAFVINGENCSMADYSYEELLSENVLNLINILPDTNYTDFTYLMRSEDDRDLLESKITIEFLWSFNLKTVTILSLK